MHVTRPLKLCIALAAAIGMFAVCFMTAFAMIQDNWLVRTHQSGTAQFLQSLRTLLEEHHMTHGVYPEKLIDLDLKKSLRMKRHLVDGEFLDYWDHPIHYEFGAESFRVRSYGQDGLPGGEGLDTDLDGTEDLSDPRLAPTFRQFVFGVCPPGMWLACSLTGVLTFALCLITTRPLGHGPNVSLAGFAAVIAVTLAIVWMVGLVLVALHVPSGH